jgi:GT2 family glycosyltransferase
VNPAPDVSVVIVSFNARQALVGCLSALQRDAARVLETFVVDNASGDGSAAAVRESFPQVRLLENATNDGFARANNRALREARGRYALVLNSDAELKPGALAALVDHLERHTEVALVGPRTRNADGTIQLSFGPRLTLLGEWRQRRLVRGVRLRDPLALAEVESLAARPHEPDWVSGSCFLARLELLRGVGCFDEAFFLYEEDADLCLRLRAAGHRVAFTPAAEVVHHLGESMSAAPGLARAEYDRSHLLYYRKHNGPVQTALLRLWLAVGRRVGRA